MGGAAPADTSPWLLDTLKLPDLRKLNLPLPRSVQAANALLGLATQRLALVVGTGHVGPQIQLPSVSRDTQAVAAALRAAGFLVMVREDLNAEDLRAALDEFRSRLQPGGTGFLYFTGLGAQVGGENVVLTRGLQVTGTGANTRLKGTAVPLQEIVEAVQGTPDSPRYLVVDAAFSHPTLATLSSQGLGPQKVPAGVMALFSQSPGVVAEAPEPFALPLPTPTDPRLTAGSTFGRELVRSLVTPKLTGAEVLRVTRGAMLDVTAGKQAPLIVGDSTSQDEFAEPKLLDTLFPRTPEDLAREGLKQALRTGGSAGEMPVSPVGNTAPVAGTPATTPNPVATASATPNENLSADSRGDGPTTQRKVLDSAARRLADGPSPTSLLSNAVGTTAAVGSVAAGAAGTAAVAGTVTAAAQASATATAMGVATSVASSAAGVLSGAATLVSGSGSSGGGGAATAAVANEASKLVRPAASLPASAGQDLPVSVVNAAPPAAPATAMAVAASTPVPATGQARTARQHNGGERPAYVPKVNPHGYAEGDTFMYRTMDTWKDQHLGNSVHTVEEVLPNGDLLTDGHQTLLDAQGRFKRLRQPDGTVSQFEPAQELWWSKPVRGQSRDIRFKETFQRADQSQGQTEWKGSASVGRLRKISTQAGEFEALPIESSGWYYEQVGGGPLNSGQWRRTVWYSPQLGHPVAIDIEDANALGKLLKRERVELLQVQTAKSLAAQVP
jgi:hypothetical protein